MTFGSVLDVTLQLGWVQRAFARQSWRAVCRFCFSRGSCWNSASIVWGAG